MLAWLLAYVLGCLRNLRCPFAGSRNRQYLSCVRATRILRGPALRRGCVHLSLDGFRIPNMIAFMKRPIRLPIFAAWFVLVILAPALPGQTEDKMAKVQALAQQLQLTPEQKVKVLPILEQEAPKLEAVKNNTSLSGLQKMKQIRAIHAETAPELQKILSPAQYQKLQAIREERIKEAMEKKRAGR